MPPHTHIRILRAALAIALLCAFTAATRAGVLRGKVVSIADGDTLTVLDGDKRQHRIRLSGIDAPESHQDFGTRARQHLAGLVFGREVAVEYEKRDRYGRTLGKVLVAGRDANLEQVRAGMAWHYKFYQDEQSPVDRRAYAKAEEEARAARRGLWADPRPTPPWDFRRGGRGAARQSPPQESASPRASPGWEEAAEEETRKLTVYVTRTGAKYHRDGCRYLRRSRIPMPLKEARKVYGACSVCRPT